MLVLGRREDERILIGPVVEIMVTKILSTQVKIGINAPREWDIIRKELTEGSGHESSRGTGIHIRCACCGGRGFIEGEVQGGDGKTDSLTEPREGSGHR